MIWIRSISDDGYGNETPDDVPIEPLRIQRKVRVRSNAKGNDSFYGVRIFLPAGTQIETSNNILMSENGDPFQIMNIYRVADSSGNEDHVEVDI